MAEPAGGLRIAIVGAESTGKTTLAGALREALAQQTGLRVAGVSEWLREWCEAQGRTPLPQEQRGIALAQQQRIDDAATAHDIVVCDTTPLMTAVYSAYCFGDHSLDAEAVALHRTIDLTLLTALDLPWQADGLQRDGAHVREPIDARLRALLMRHGLAFSVIGGQGERRLQRALAAVQPMLRNRTPARPQARDAASTPRANGLFSGTLQGRSSSRWRCECCEPDAVAAERADTAARRNAPD